MEHNTLRKLIREMLEKKHADAEEQAPVQSEQKIPNTDDTCAITVQGDPIKDVKLNTLVKNPTMTKNGAKPHVNSQGTTAARSGKE